MMAFHWLKVHADLPFHPKSIELGVVVENPLAWAHVVQLWGWCLRNAPDGRVSSRHAGAVVENACGWRGAKGILFEALVSVGFLEREESCVVVHDWDEEQRPVLEKAARDAQKKRERRADGAETARAGPGDGAAPLSLSLSVSNGSSFLKEEAPVETPVALPVPEMPDGAGRFSSGDAFFAWVQGERADAGLAVERFPREVGRWFHEATLELGSDGERLEATFKAFLRDTYWRERNWPFRAFMKQWREFAPRKTAVAV